MDINECLAALEAILFACGEAVAADRIEQVLGVDEQTVDSLCQQLQDRYDDTNSALQIIRLDDKYQLCTRREYADHIRAMLDIRRNTPLSPAAMEVLAVVAYNEPVTKSFVEQVRGVDCSGVMTSLINKNLVEEAGRLEAPGRPILYRTSDLFLRCFGLESLGQLPKLPGSISGEEVEGQISLDELALEGAQTDTAADVVQDFDEQDEYDDFDSDEEEEFDDYS